MPKQVDITNKKFNRLTAVKFVEKRGNFSYWLFRCDCGNEVVYRKNNVTAKITKTKSCGCLNLENTKRTGFNNKTHGMSEDKFYYVYKTMRSRCGNPKSHKFYRYGARGIKCLWKRFEDFRDDMYVGYIKHKEQFGDDTTIDRIDNDDSYYKENCRWVTNLENIRNRSISYG